MRFSKSFKVIIFIAIGLLVVNFAVLASDKGLVRLNDESADVVADSWFRSLGSGHSIEDVVRAPNGEIYILVEDYRAKRSIVATVLSDGAISPNFSLETKPNTINGMALLDGSESAIITNRLVHNGSNFRVDDLERETGQGKRFYHFASGYRSTLKTIGQLEVFDATGNLLWKNVLNDGNDARVVSIAGEKRHLYVAGYKVPKGTTRSDAFITKFDEDGKELWSAIVDAPSPDRISSQWIEKVIVGPDGKAAVLGTSVAHWMDNERSFHGKRNWVAQIGELGKVEWLLPLHQAGPGRKYDGRPTEVRPIGLHITQDGIYGWGYFGRHIRNGIVFLVKHNGSLAWMKEMSTVSKNGKVPIKLLPFSISGSSVDGLVIGGRAFTKSNEYPDAWLGSLTSDGLLKDFRIYGRGWNSEAIEHVISMKEKTGILAFGNIFCEGPLCGHPFKEGWLMSTDLEGRMSADAVRSLIETGSPEVEARSPNIFGLPYGE